ncbi:calcineurin family phosphoesterase [Rhodotorula taiwanensis]|uniref:Calcineurin family phosphoesterase n=1 Tax=Rhodotorula taiwanensis TaxID=741276 RepID=A0A2S5BIC6_9BASI|nr:calcineurin family phosphoesterase [Rhodotorula taiwanensis]
MRQHRAATTLLSWTWLVSAARAALEVFPPTAQQQQLRFSTGHHPHKQEEQVTQQPDSSDPADWPYRDLPWGQVNFIATTDTHGWLLGHQRHEPSFSGDWGDFYSFTHRMKQEARRRGVDLLLVDSGDRVDGNGLVDADPHVKGSTALDLFSQIPYDVVTTGNHELYKYPVADYVGRVMHDKFRERWVVSNVNISEAGDDNDDDDALGKPFGNRFRAFKTEQGRRVTAFAHAQGTIVQPPSAMVREPWFQEAISTPPDFFLFVGHMSVDIEPDSEWRIVVEAIRQVHQRIPVVVFGGHHHVRQCARYDEYSIGLAAGRYMETIGFLSMSGLDETATKAPSFRRRYLDQNRNTYAYHAGKNFDTPRGRAITQRLSDTAAAFNLTDTFGHAPQDYFLYRYPHTSEHSVLNLMTREVLPKMVTRTDRPYEMLMLLNSGSIRFDIFKGPFTRNDQWIILPFTNAFLYVPAVPRHLAAKLLHYLNIVGEHGLTLSGIASSSSADAAYLEGDLALAADAAKLEHRYRRAALAASSEDVRPFPAAVRASRPRKDRRPSEGYVTLDPAGCASVGGAAERYGDDTLHRPFKSSWQPVFVATALPPSVRPNSDLDSGLGSEGEEDDDDRVDVVFFDFIKLDILSALNALDLASTSASTRQKRWSEEDVRVYLEGMTANTLMEQYARRYWQ